MTATATEANTELIDRTWDEVVEHGEMDVIDEAVTSEYVLHTPAAPEPIQGREGLKQYKRTLRAGFPDLSVSIETRIVGDETVVDRYRMHGTHDGEFMGIAPTGEEVEFTGIIIHYLDDGAVVENVAEFNVLDFMQQLGIVEIPGA